MKFLLLTQYFVPEPGAAQARLAGMVRELTRAGHEVEVVTAFPNYPAGRIDIRYRGLLYRRETWEGVTVHRVWLYAAQGAGVRRALNYLSFAVTVLLGLRKVRQCDFVFVESPPPTLGIAGLIASRLYHAPLILNVADLWPDTARDFGIFQQPTILKMAERFERWMYRKADFVCAVTEGIRNALITAKGVPASKVLFLPNGIDTATYRPMPPELALKRQLGLEGRQLLVYPGTLGHAHSADAWLHAADRLRDTNVHFLFIGGGSAKEDLVALAHDLKLSNVTFLDPVPAEDVPRWLSIADVGLVSVRNAPILDGARPAKMFAIMACGKAILYAGAGEGARLLEQAGAGIVVPVEQPEAIAGAIRQLLSDPARAAELGTHGQRYAADRFPWDKLIADWLQQLRAASPQAAHHAEMKAGHTVA